MRHGIAGKMPMNMNHVPDIIMNEINEFGRKKKSPAMRINPGDKMDISVSSGWAKGVVLVTDVFGISQCIRRCLRVIIRKSPDTADGYRGFEIYFR